MSAKHFLGELKRRNVYKVAAAYAIVGWVIIQVATQVFPFFEVPNWAVRLVVLLIVIGFPVALLIAWAFELTPEGIKRAEDVDPDPRASRGNAWIYVVAIGTAVSIGLFFLGRYTAPSHAARMTPKSIAVLPFKSLSEDMANAFFADGIQDEILARLSKIAELKVISRTSTQKYKSSPANLRDIAQELGVANILEGSVQRAAEKVRITVQLINATTDQHLWSETYDRKLIDVFDVESDVAQKIAVALEAKLSGREKSDISATGTTNAEAYDAYLHGLALSNSATEADLEKSIEYFRHAVEFDPNFAQAWAQLSINESFKYYFPETTEQQKNRARVAADTALRLAPDMVETHTALGLFYYYCLKDFDRALSELKIASERDPNNANTIFSIGLVKRRQGKLDEAIALQEQAARLDPLNTDIWTNLAGSYRGIRKIAKARALLDRSLTLAPNDLGVIARKAETFLAEGDVEGAWKILSAVKFPPIELGFSTTIDALVFQRRFDEARGMITAALADKTLPPRYHAVALSGLAHLELVHGDPGRAHELFTQAEAELKKLQADGDSSLFLLGALIDVEAYLGHRPEVDRLAQEAMERVRNDLWESPRQEEVLARACVALGDLDRALPLLAHVLIVPYDASITPAYLRLDPSWDNARKDPRFQKLANGQP